MPDMLKKRGNLLIALGLLLLIGAAGLTVYNLNADKNAGQEAVAVIPSSGFWSWTDGATWA